MEFLIWQKQIEHFIFVPGLGAGARHPVGRHITEAIQRETAGIVSVHLAKVCDEIGNVIVSHSLERQAEALAEQIRKLKGDTALFAHSQAGIAVAMTLAHADFPQLDPANVFLAGTPLDSQLSRQRTEARAFHETTLVGLVRAKVPTVSNIECVKRQPRDMALPAARYVAITQEHLASYPPTEEHVANLQALGACTLLVSGNEEITDCTPPNIMAKLPGRRNAVRPDALNSRTIVLEGADHSLTGLCEKEVPALILERIGTPVTGGYTADRLSYLAIP